MKTELTAQQLADALKGWLNTWKGNLFARGLAGGTADNIRLACIEKFLAVVENADKQIKEEAATPTTTPPPQQ